MTNFLSKLFLCGIVLSSVNGYCDVLKVNAGTENGSAASSLDVQNSDTVFTTDVVIGTYNEGEKVTDNAKVSTSNEKSLTMGEITIETEDEAGNKSTTTEGTTLTILEHGTLVENSMINLADKSKLVLMPGSIAGNADASANVKGGQLDISNYIVNESNAPKFDSTNAKNVNLNLDNCSVDFLTKYMNGESDIKSMNTIIKAFNDAGDTKGLFSGISGKITVPNIPYVITFEENNGFDSIDKIKVDEIASGTKYVFNSINQDVLTGLFADGAEIYNINNAQTLFDNFYKVLDDSNTVLSDGESNKNVQIDVDSFKNILAKDQALSLENSPGYGGSDKKMQIQLVTAEVNGINMKHDTDTLTFDGKAINAKIYNASELPDNVQKIVATNIPANSTMNVGKGGSNKEFAVNDSSDLLIAMDNKAQFSQFVINNAKVIIKGGTVEMNTVPSIKNGELTLDGTQLVL